MSTVLPFPAVDVHAHYLSPAYRAALAAAGIDRPDGFPHIPDWDLHETIALMDEIGVAVSVLAISSPGVHFLAGEPRRDLARRVNEDGAAIVAQRPDRFGLLATLPLPDVDAALAEIAHAGDTLGVDGFVLMTNYDGVYLGDPSLAEVMGELDRRGAVVALHPTSPVGSEAVTLGRPRPMIEFPIDTTRTVVDLILGGTLTRHPRIRFIVPHVGGALASLADRVSAFASIFLNQPGTPNVDVIAQLAEFHYDLTGAALPHAVPVLRQIAKPNRLLYGSDPPFSPPAAIRAAAQALANTSEFDDDGRRAMLFGNAVALFPRLQPLFAGA